LKLANCDEVLMRARNSARPAAASAMDDRRGAPWCGESGDGPDDRCDSHAIFIVSRVTNRAQTDLSGKCLP